MPVARIWIGSICIGVSICTLLHYLSSASAQSAFDVHINEFIPNPIGDDASLEFIELYNNTDTDVDVSGWIVDTGGSARFSIDSGTMVPSKGYLTFFSAQKPISLTNSGDHIKLLLADGVTAQDDIVYSSSKEGYSYNRLENGEYQQSSHSTPNSENILDPTPTPSISPSPSPSPIASVMPSITPIPSYADSVFINEFLPNPVGNDAELEFIELLNTADEPIDISGWMVDDASDAGSSPYTIPNGTVLDAQGYIVVYSVQIKISLSNDSDHVRLLDPLGNLHDDVTYGSSREGYSYNRLLNGNFSESVHLTPGEGNIIENPTSTPKPTVTPKPITTPIRYDFSTKIVINELFPYPQKDSDQDEFVELKNTENRTISLYGWSVDDSEKGSVPYHFKQGDVIPPQGVILIEKINSHIAFNNDKDSARLLDPTGKIIAHLEYEKPVPGQSFNRLPDGTYGWSEIITPGKENTIYVQMKDTEEKAKKSTEATRKKLARVAGTSMVNRGFTQSVLIPWASIIPYGPIRQSIVGDIMPQGSASTKKTIFFFLGICLASWQAFSGITHKERIWRWKK